MSYYFSTTLETSFLDAVEQVTHALQQQGFGILTRADVRDTFKRKLGTDTRNYLILGACNPPYAFKALQAEQHVGLLLPCNVIVFEIEDGIIEVAAIDPAVSMRVVDNPSLADIAGPVREKLRAVIDSL